MMKICHLTSAHPRYDTRIFVKQCSSLADNGYETYLIVADGNGDEVKNKVQIFDVGKQAGRLSRIVHAAKNVYIKAIELDADIYHLHDPELMLYAKRLKQKGKTVIFDAHEDLPKQMLGKPYLKKWQAKLLSKSIKIYENHVLSRISGVVAATPYIRDKFSLISNNVVDVNNYPKLEEFRSKVQSAGNAVCYIGGLSRARGIGEVVRSLQYSDTDGDILVAGKFLDHEFELEVKELSEWKEIQMLGFLDRAGISDLLSKSCAGLVTLHPLINYLDSLPVKMFEYMAAGIPVIASDFPYWRGIIEEHQCGICVNPLSPESVAEGIDYMRNNREIALQMGANGRKAIEDKLNWNVEFEKLVAFYNTCIN